MSKTELYLTNEEIETFIKDVKQDTSTIYGYEEQQLGICPYITFYIYHDNFQDDFPSISEKIINVYQEFENTIIDRPFKNISFQCRERYFNKWFSSDAPNIPADWVEQANWVQNNIFQPFTIMATDAEFPQQSAQWATKLHVELVGRNSFSYLKLSFGKQWFQENKEKWFQ